MTCTECYGRGWRITDVGIVVHCLKEFNINSPHHGDCPKKPIEEMVSDLRHVIRTHEPMLEALTSMVVLVEAISKSGRLCVKAEENLNLQIGDAWRKAKAAIAAVEGGTDGEK